MRWHVSSQRCLGDLPREYRSYEPSWAATSKGAIGAYRGRMQPAWPTLDYDTKTVRVRVTLPCACATWRPRISSATSIRVCAALGEIESLESSRCFTAYNEGSRLCAAIDPSGAAAGSTTRSGRRMRETERPSAKSIVIGEAAANPIGRRTDDPTFDPRGTQRRARCPVVLHEPRP